MGENMCAIQTPNNNKNLIALEYFGIDEFIQNDLLFISFSEEKDPRVITEFVVNYIKNKNQPSDFFVSLLKKVQCFTLKNYSEYILTISKMETNEINKYCSLLLACTNKIGPIYDKLTTEFVYFGYNPDTSVFHGYFNYFCFEIISIVKSIMYLVNNYNNLQRGTIICFVEYICENIKNGNFSYGEIVEDKTEVKKWVEILSKFFGESGAADQVFIGKLYEVWQNYL